MIFGVYFAFEGTLNAVHVAIFTTGGFRVVKCQNLTTLICGRIDYLVCRKLSEAHSTKCQCCGTIDTIKIAYLDMFMVPCPPESNVVVL